MARSDSFFERLIVHQTHPWRTVGVGIVLVLVPLAAAYVEGVLAELLATGQWRTLIVPPVIILYILIVAPRLSNMDTAVVEALKQVALVDDQAFDRVVAEASAVNPRKYGTVFIVGALLGLTLVLMQARGSVSLVVISWGVLTVLMFGLFGLTVYGSYASTRLTAAILSLPLRVEPLDTTPFGAIGRQSLVLALVFVGGITLSLLFTVFQPGVLRVWAFWVSYVPMALVPIVIFFLNMRPTHRVLSDAKNQELRNVRAQLAQASQVLMQRLAEDQDTLAQSQATQTLLAFEQRLANARTWPYDTATLRTLFVSVLIPAATVLARLVLARP